MRIFRRRAARKDSDSIATHLALHAHGAVTTIVSAVALLFSGYSLWETSLKQADVSVYVTGVVTYDRDATASYITPAGGFEVFAVPVTIANSGARDVPILGLQLDASNPGSGMSARFEATYTVDGTYFAASSIRAKTPFSALVIPGRSSWTGTVLFYPVSYSNGKALTPVGKLAELRSALRKKYASDLDKAGTASLEKLRDMRPDLPELAAEVAELDASRGHVLRQNERIEVALQALSPAPSGWLDRVFGATVRPVAFALSMPDIPEGVVGREKVRLRSAAGS